MKNKYTFFFLLQISISCFAAEKEVGALDSEAETSGYQYSARWIYKGSRLDFQQDATYLLGLGLDPKYLQILDSEKFFSLCGGEQYIAPWGRRGEICTHYGVAYRKTLQAILHMNFLLQNRSLPSADLFSMIMKVVPDKALTKVSVISLFHLANFLEKRAVKIGNFKGFLSFYHRMLHTTRETNWIQLMIELAKTKKEFGGGSIDYGICIS